MLTTAKPAVRVDVAWNQPARTRIPGLSDMTVSSLSYGFTLATVPSNSRKEDVHQG